MGTVQRLIAGPISGAITGPVFFAAAVVLLQGDVTEANHQLVCRTPGTLANFQVTVTGNFGVGPNTVQSRKNGAAGTLSVSIPNATTGAFYDTVNSDSLGSGDTYAIKLVDGTLNLGVIAVEWTPTTGSVQRWAVIPQNTIASGQTKVFGVTGDVDPQVETSIEWKAPVPATRMNGQIYIPTNSLNGATTVTSRKNNANGNVSISIGSGLTGTFEDLVNTDSFAVGDTAATQVVTAGSSGTLTIGTLSTDITFPDVEKTHVFAAVDTDMGFGQTTTRYCPLGVGNTHTATETDVQVRLRHAVTFANARAHVVTNTLTATMTGTFRKNAADGNQALSIPAGVTGYFEDIAQIDACVVGDDVAWGFTQADSNGAHAIIMYGISTLAVAAATYPVLDSTASGTSASSTTVSCTLQVRSWANRLCMIAVVHDIGIPITGVTVGGVAAAFVATKDVGSGFETSETWQLVAPAIGSQTVTATMSSSSPTNLIEAASYQNVNQATPLGTAATSSGNSTTPSLTITSAINERAFASIWHRNGAAGYTVTGGQTDRITIQPSYIFVSSDIAGAATVTPASSHTNSNGWCCIGVSMKAAAGVTYTLMGQAWL